MERTDRSHVPECAGQFPARLLSKILSAVDTNYNGWPVLFNIDPGIVVENRHTQDGVLLLLRPSFLFET